MGNINILLLIKIIKINKTRESYQTVLSFGLKAVDKPGK